MRRRICAAAVAVVLCLASSTALAHGIEVFIQLLVICGAVVGLVGGVATVVLPYRALRSAVIGFVASEGLLFAVGMVYALMEIGTSSDPMGDLGAMALWLAVFAAGPLALAFFVAFAGASMFRRHVWPHMREREPAP